jgi:inner membrane transporter RhtA
VTRPRLSPPPALLVIASSTSFQLGTAIARTAFDEAGPLGTVWLRGVFGAGLLLLYVRPNLRAITRAKARAVLPYALSLVALIGCNYLAIANAPLGIVSAILMLGPLGVAAFGYRTWLDYLCVALALVGVTVLALAEGVSGPLSPLGLLLSLGGAASFAAYIVTGKRIGRETHGFEGLAIALIIATLIQTPFGLAFGLPGMWTPQVLLATAAAGLLATVIPFTFEITALRSLSAATFGFILAFEPAIAAVVGFVVLGQALVATQLVGIGIVIAAGALSAGPRGWTRRIGSYNRGVMSNPTVAALARVPLFAGLSARDLGTIASVAEERDVPAGAHLTDQGGEGHEFFIVAAGEVDVTIDGREVRRMGPGEFLGEIALVFGGPRTATAVATAPTHLYVLGEAAFSSMLKKQPRIEDKILTSVAERMRYR